MIWDDTRAVSVAVNHTIMLGITAILISGLLISSGSLLQTQENRVAQQQIDEIGADILTHVNTLDRLKASGESVDTTVRLDYPARIIGDSYTVSFVNESGQFDANSTLQIDAQALGRTVSYPIPNDVVVNESSARGNNPQLRLCSDDRKIRFGTCP